VVTAGFYLKSKETYGGTERTNLASKEVAQLYQNKPSGVSTPRFGDGVSFEFGDGVSFGFGRWVRSP